jgi:hypothetical protein
MAIKGSLHSLIGPKPACSTSQRVAKQVIREGLGLQRAPAKLTVNPRKKTRKELPFNAFCKRTVEFLKLNRIQAIHVTGLLTGHSQKGPHLQMGITNSPVFGNSLTYSV